MKYLRDVSRDIEQNVKRENDKRDTAQMSKVFSDLLDAYTRGLGRNFNGSDAMNIQALMLLAESAVAPVIQYDNALKLAVITTARAVAILAEENENYAVTDGVGPEPVNDIGAPTPLGITIEKMARDQARADRSKQGKLGAFLVEEMLKTVGGDWSKMQGREWLPHWSKEDGLLYSATMREFEENIRKQQEAEKMAQVPEKRHQPHELQATGTGEDLSRYFRSRGRSLPTDLDSRN